MATESFPLDSLKQRWELPARPRPIVVVGAGSIVRDAHLPTYARLGFSVAGIFDVNPAAARERADQFRLPRTFDSLKQAFAVEGAVFDVAVPPDQIAGILEKMRPGSAVLIQKPMGRDLADARRILALCRERKLIAAMNFQLRFAPNMLALRDAIAHGLLGELTDLELRIVLHTPWNYWAFLKGVPRLEVLMHSIHYLDFVRSILGEPQGVYCKGLRHPELPDYPDVRTSIILDYGDTIRASLVMNHAHRFGARHAVSELKLEGTRAAAIAKMGVNLNYPHGEPDRLEIVARDGDWRDLPLRGSWFLEAFEGPMANLQRVVAGEDKALVSPIEDAFKTMALVEACYESSAHGGAPIARE
ncbi:MAG TPA: Gfo/Idh/MocA family oxidoreductase [Candidatus Binataceae bacterium]|nr:Gfo/Idh/MocA family oxidoreductase [Candidatus Binataceae bacterium]